MCVWQKATQQVQEQAEPMAKDITRGIIAPGAQEIAKNAVPITEEVSNLHTPQKTATLLKMVQKST